MKKISLIFLSAILTVFSVFAYQQTYRADSEEVVLFKYLRMQSGTSTVEPTMPISSEQLLICLNSLDSSRLEEQDRNRLYELIEKLENSTSDFEIKKSGYGSIDFDASLNVQGTVRYSNTPLNNDDTVQSSDNDLFFLDHLEQMPIAEIQTLAVTENHLAGKIRLGYQKPIYENSLLNKRFLTNFTGLYDGTVPYEAWISAGGKTINFVLGRDKVSSGNGKSGNLSISDNFIYQNFAKASYISPWISYDLTFLAFDKHASYDYFNEYEKATSCVFTEFLGYSPIVANHRLSVNFSKKFVLTLFEGMLECGDNTFDIRLLNPFMVLHNYDSFVGNNNNNYVGLEFGLTLPHGFEISGQFILDQLQLSYEEDSSAKAPNAYGALLNISKSLSYGKWYSVFSLEGAYTSPCLYLKADKYFDGSENFEYYDSDLIVGNKLSYYTDLNYLGYKYGPNSIVLSASASFEGPRVSTETELTYRIRGEYRIGDKIKEDFAKYSNITPFLTGENVAEHDLFLKVNSKFDVYKGFYINAGFDGKYCFNFDNIKDKKYFDTQFSVSVIVKPLDFFKK